MAEYLKIVVVPFTKTISEGTAKEVWSDNNEHQINLGRQAYASLGNVIIQPATQEEYLNYSYGLEIFPNEDNRKLSVITKNNVPHNPINELQKENFGF